MGVDASVVIRLEAGANGSIGDLEAYAAALGGGVEVRVHLPGWSYRVR